MNSMFKIDDNNKILFEMNQGSIMISRGYLEDLELKKTFSLVKDDDYIFEAWVNDKCYDIDTINEISFEILQGDLLYESFSLFLGESNQIIIDDDYTRENNKKMIISKKENNRIILSFINNLMDCYDYNKFSVFVKNICFDLRSKIDQNNYDTKKRLHSLFNNFINVLSNNDDLNDNKLLVKKNVNDKESLKNI